jgi:hypothetical protein
LIRTDRLRTVTPASSSTLAERAMRRNGRWQATTPGGAMLHQPRGSLADAGAPGDPCVQPGDPHGELPPALPSAHLDRQVHGGDGPSCVDQRLPPGVLAGRRHHRRGHHPQPAATPRGLGPDVARTPATQPDP